MLAIVDDLDLFQHPVRGMILSRTVPVGVSTVPVTLNQDMKALKPRGRLRAQYLALYLKSVAPALLSLVAEAGHGTKALRTDLWTKLPVLLPPENEQLEIESELARIREEMEKKRDALMRSIALLREYRLALVSAAVTGHRGMVAGEVA